MVRSKVHIVPSIAPQNPLASRGRPWLTIVIVNYNGWDDVARLAGTLANAPEVASGACEVIVVDNASDGSIPSELLPPAFGVRLILRDNNGGFAVGVNAGWKASRASWLLLLNPDVETDPTMIGQVLARIRVHEGHSDGPPGIVGFRLENPDGSTQPSVGVAPGVFRSLMGQFIPRSRRKYQSDWRVRNGSVPWVTGACMLVHGEVMDALGGMDEDFFLYYEEVALCTSVRKIGRRVEYDDSVAVVHLRPLQDREVSPKMRIITRHSKLLYFRKHLPRWQFAAIRRVVSIEAKVRGWAALRRGEMVEARAWRIIGVIAHRMSAGERVRGHEVLAMAESIARQAPAPMAISRNIERSVGSDHGMRGECP